MLKSLAGSLLLLFAFVNTQTAFAVPEKLTVEAKGNVKRYLDRVNIVEREREQEFRLDRPNDSRQARNAIRLRVRAGEETRWMNELLFEDIGDLGLLEMIEAIVKRHVPEGVHAVDIEITRMTVPNASIAGIRGPNFWMKGTIREVNASGEVIAEKNVSAYQPYRNTQVVPYTGDGYIVQQGPFGTPVVTLAAYWALEALGQLYPDQDIPRLFTATNL